DAEAEELIREALEGLRAFDLRAGEREALVVLVDFYRDRGRDDEVPPLEERLAELASGSKAGRVAWLDASSGDSLITLAGRSNRASASFSGSARSVPSP